MIIREENLLMQYILSRFLQLNYLEHFLVLACTITGCTSIPAFASFLELQVSMPQQLKKKKNDKIVLSAKS